MDFYSFLDSRLRGNDTGAPLTRRCRRHRRPFPQRGEADCFLGLKCYRSSWLGSPYLSGPAKTVLRENPLDILQTLLHIF